MGIALQKLAGEEDQHSVPTPNQETGETVIAGMGELRGYHR